MLLLLIGSGVLEASGQQQTAITFNNSAFPNIAGYYQYLPAGYATSGIKYPVILFVHGVGELQSAGAPLSAVLRNGLPRFINEGKFPNAFTVNGQQYSFIVISPQFKNWPNAVDCKKLIDYLSTQLRIDMDRVYITGLSMGGGVTWGAISEVPDLAKGYAAAVPVAGAYKPTEALAANIAKATIAVWALHNKGDDNPGTAAQFSIDWVNYINKANPNPPARLTLFDATGHGGWEKAYDPNYREEGKNIYEWMLQYTVSDVTTPPPPPPPPPPAGAKRIAVPMSNSAGGRREIYYPNAMTSLGVNPGDTLCIPAGDYEYIHFGNLVGTADKKIVITNCGGQVRLGVSNQGTASVWSLATCSNIEISGSGAPGVEFGFDLNGTNIKGDRIFGMTLGTGSTDFEIHHVYIHEPGIALQAKTLQSCALPQYLEGAFVMRNVKIHHVKVRNSLWEGFYIGNTHYFWDEGTCTNMRSHWIENLEVYNNDLENIGSDGIQLSMTRNGSNKIYNNRLVNYGMGKNDAHGYGILVGSGCALEVFSNYISGGYMPAVNVFGNGITKVYNNVISNITYEGIGAADKIPAGTDPSLFPPATVYAYNNTIVNTDGGKNSVKIYAYLTTIPHRMYNNLSVVNGTDYDYPARGMYIKGDKTILVESGNNLQYSTADAAGLLDAASGNFHLKAGSPAIDKGRDARDMGIAADFDQLPRPQGNAFDVGAFEFNANPGNVTPVANAGADITITLPVNTAALDGAASRDADGSIASFAWKKESGPAGGDLSAATSAKTNISNLVEGTYVFSLRVTDNSGAVSVPDEVTIVVKPAVNQKPVVKAGANTTITLPVNTATLDGSATSDPDGSVAAYAWKQLGGPAAATIANSAVSATTATFSQAGTYVFQLKATDNQGASDSAQVTVIVNPANNVAPVANAGNNATITLPATKVTLDGSASADSDGTIVKYRWKQLSGAAGADIADSTIARTEATLPALPGVYIFQLTVTDNGDAAAIAQVTITVNDAAKNALPVANAGSNTTITLPQQNANLDGSASTDSDGSIVSYAWTQLGGPAATIASPAAAKSALTLTVSGTYVFQLKVTDNQGATATSQVTFFLNPANNIPPVANPGADITIQLPVSTATLDASASTDADGTIVGYKWYRITGPTDVKFSNDAAVRNVVSGMVEGTYVFELHVTDDKGAKSIARVRIIVLKAAPQPNQAPVANAGSNASITLPQQSAQLDGSASSDSDGSIVSYTWTQLGGPAATIASPAAARSGITLTVAGTYVFQLKVTDNAGATSTAQVTVILNPANNIPPVANAGADITIKLPVSATMLDGIASTDADGSIAAYKWSRISGPTTVRFNNDAASRTEVSGLAEGVYVFELMVTDDKGGKATANVRVTVLTSDPVPNQLPVAAVTAVKAVELPQDFLMANASASKDQDGSIVSFAWKLVSGPAQPVFSVVDVSQCRISGLTVEGTYVFELTVTDDKGATDSKQFSVKVIAAWTDAKSAAIKVYPTLVTAQFFLEVNTSTTGGATGNIMLTLYGLSGNVALQQRLPDGGSKRTVDVSALPAGVYIVDVLVGNTNQRKQIRIVKVAR
ncbi:PKD domain-containing protein [Chitinophaga lutea]